MCTYFHHACDELGLPQAFTLNLNDEIEEKARRHPTAASFLQKRIAAELRAAFGRSIDFWFVLENARERHTGRKRLHIHGEIVVDAAEAAQARAALRRAAGEWESVRQHQAHTKPLPDEAWVGYCLKDNAKNNRRNPYAGARGFNGNHYACARGITRRAAQLYDADRDRFLDGAS